MKKKVARKKKAARPKGGLADRSHSAGIEKEMSTIEGKLHVLTRRTVQIVQYEPFVVEVGIDIDLPGGASEERVLEIAHGLGGLLTKAVEREIDEATGA